MRNRRLNKLTYPIAIGVIIISIKYIDKIVLLLFALLVSVIIVNQLYKYITSRSYLEKDLSEIDSMKGEEFEKYLAVKYKDKGYKVRQTKKTGDYGADLILEKGFERIIVQAKRYDKPVGVKAVQEAVSAKVFYDGAKAIVITNNYFTPNAKTMASKCNVTLIDRDILINTFLKRGA